MTRSALRARSSAEDQMLELQARTVGTANLTMREGDIETTRDLQIVLGFLVEITTRHAMRGTASATN